MKPTKESIIEQMNKILSEYQNSRHNFYSDREGENTVLLQQIIHRILNVLQRFSPPGSPYYINAYSIMKEKEDLAYQANELAGILTALREDYKDDFLETVYERIHAELFADFLEMAEYLQKDGFKDAAAVIAGSTLEEHLRKLCIKHGIDPIIQTDDGDKPLKADRLNAELAKAEAYNKLEQKNVTAWLDLRNNAAHGHYEEYDHKQVASMIQDIRNFMVRNPA